MAFYSPGAPPAPIEISQFLGLNEAIGETEIVLGQATKQVNFRITQNFKPQKREGHRTFLDFGNTKPIRAMWYGTIGEKEVLISSNDGKIYEYNFATSTNSQIGTMTDAVTSIIYFESKLYFLDGTSYKEYDGTTFKDVEPYIPTVAIATPPAGGGTVFEPINLLTGKKKQEFQGDGTAKEYQLTEKNIDAGTVTCTIDGATKTEGTDFNVNRTSGKVTFNTAPANGALVVLGWTKVEPTHKDLVLKNRYATTFGPGNDTAIFLWGNPDAKNRRTWSGTLKANYFPVYNFTLIGTDEFAITDIKTVYSRQIIFKEDRTYFSPPEWIEATGGYDYPVYDLNEKVGNVAFNGVQIVNNMPLSLKGGSFWHWANTAVEDERNAEVISERMRESLADVDLTKAVTFDYQKKKEYWCNVGDRVYIWNYGNNTMYIYDNISATCFLEVDGMVYYGSNGTIERMGALNEIGNPYLTDNGEPIIAELELGFTDVSASHIQKNSRKLWFTIQPYVRTSVKTYWQTDRKALTEDKAFEVSFRFFEYPQLDYGDWSYQTNRNPQPYRKKIRAKKYAYIKFIFNNKKIDEQLVILSIKFEAETTSEVK